MATVLLKINDQTEMGKHILSLVKSNPAKGVEVVSSKKTSDIYVSEKDNNREFRQKMQGIRNRLIERHNAIADDKIK